MKSREYFGKWPPRNVFGPDRQELYDEHNRSFKKERPEQPNEYASFDVEEYYRVPETKDESGNPYERNDDAKSQQSKQRDSKSMKRMNMIRSVTMLAAGSVVVVTSYQAAIARQQQNTPDEPSVPVVQPDVSDSDTTDSGETEPSPAVFAVKWVWSDDKQDAILEIYDINGILLKELPAVISIEETAPTCNTEGLRTFTAFAEYEDNEYSDSQTEPIPPTGHEFGEGTEVVLENGQTALVFECAHCHEKFTVITSMTETD